MGNRVKLPGRVESAEMGGIVTGAGEILDDLKGKTQEVINTETDAELLRLDQTKQVNLTFDQTPTENSTNPVTSGGVYAADQLLSQAIEAILLLIPSAASALNKLVDLATMNSSISTATASFKGTYNLVSDLHLGVDATHAQIEAALDALSLNADNNDYAFVQVPNSGTAPTEIKKTERYKFNGTGWKYEYDLNNSGFTSAQWTAINSGITNLLVSKLSALPTSADLASALAGKQDVLTFDNVPTAGSPNPVTSGGVYSRNNEIVALINALDAAKQDVLTFDSSPINGSTNPVTSNGVYLAISIVQTAIVALDGRMGTAETDIVNLQAAYAALTQSDIVIVEGALPSTGQQQNVIYRQPDQGHTPPQFYADYLWNGTAYVLMAQYDNGIDDVPTPGSNNLVKSGGVAAVIVYDISEAHNGQPYVDLAAALGTNGENVPSSIRKGGMSVKFIQGNALSSDHKYVQYRLMKNTWSTTVSNWQGVDDVPTDSSNNLVKSGGVYGLYENPFSFDGYLNSNGEFVSAQGWVTTDYIPVYEGLTYKIWSKVITYAALIIAFYDENKNLIDKVRGDESYTTPRETIGEIPEGIFYVRGCSYTYYDTTYIPSFAVFANNGIGKAIGKAYTESINNVLGTLKQKYLEHTYTENGYIPPSTGQFTPDASGYWKSTDFIPVLTGQRYDISVYSQSAAAVVAFYDKDKNFISAIRATGSSISQQSVNGIIPSDCYYIKSCNYNASGTASCQISPNFDLINDKLLNLNILPIITSYKFTNDGYLNTSGELVSAQIWKATDYIPVIKTSIYNVYVNAPAAASAIAFYRKDKTFISSIRGITPQDYIELEGTIPDDCYYVRCCSYQPDSSYCRITVNEAIINNLFNSIKSVDDFVVNEFIDFTIPVNQYVVDNSDTQNHLIDNESNIINVKCMLKLPKTYTATGKPSKLIMICHGAGSYDDITDYKNESYYNNLVNEFTGHGYVVFDCTGYDNTQIGMNFWGAPKAVNTWRKAYDYVVNHYNVEKDMCIYGFSMGGLTAMNLILNNMPNVKCVGVGSPVLDLQKCWNSGVQSQMIASYGISAWTQELYAGNNPFGNIYTENNVNYFRKQLPPLKIWYGGTEDGTELVFVDKEDAKNLVSAIKNSNGTAFYREIAGCGHEICYGGNANVNQEIRMFFDRYSY